MPVFPAFLCRLGRQRAVIALLLLTACAGAQAQTASDAPAFAAPDAATDAFDQGGPSLSPTPVESLPLNAVPFAGSPADGSGDEYWIVSSRFCQVHERRHCTKECLAYFRRQPSGLARGDEAAFRGTFRPGRPVCIVVHGSYNSFHDVVEESRDIHRWIRSAAPAQSLDVVFFTWPATGHAPFLFPIEIAVLGRRSAVHSVYLTQLISSFPAEQPLCLVGHSHGARAVLASLHLLGGGRLAEGNGLATGVSPPRRIRAALYAPAVDHHWIDPGERYGNALFPVERMLIVRNSEDAALGLYPLRKPFGHRSLGRSGLRDNDRYRLHDLYSKIDEYDAAPFVGTRHAWFNYYELPQLAQGLQPYLDFQYETLDLPPETGGPALQVPTGDHAAPNRAPVIPDAGITDQRRVNLQ